MSQIASQNRDIFLCSFRSNFFGLNKDLHTLGDQKKSKISVGKSCFAYVESNRNIYSLHQKKKKRNQIFLYVYDVMHLKLCNHLKRHSSIGVSLTASYFLRCNLFFVWSALSISTVPSVHELTVD